ncbi:MAG: DUF938 domain-containing protein [Proteobacteria bacterium]|nr:DUF938 domain-containing protein [Pseudomonadota bacterium]
MTDKPFSPSCERNREPILAVLREQFAECHRVLEIGSGTGQHAVCFAAAMPWLRWQCSDRAEHLPGIRTWLDEAALPNTPAPVELDVAVKPWLQPALDPAPPSSAAAGGASPTFDAAFSANTLHIMGWPEVEAFFAGVNAVLGESATLVVYGPFNYGGAYSSPSNREFAGWLQARDSASGIRDFEAVDRLAHGIGLRLVEDVAMPANNRCLVWRR